MDPSPRELEIWRRISLGERRKQIAFEMHIDVKTLDAHKAHLAAKLGINGENAAMLTRRWFELGMEDKECSTAPDYSSPATL